MQQQGVASDTIIYSDVINVCGKCKLPERCFEVLKAVQQQCIVPDAIAFTALTQGISRSG